MDWATTRTIQEIKSLKKKKVQVYIMAISANVWQTDRMKTYIRLSMVRYRFLTIGAGSWGTALALLLARNGHQVSLWSREASHRKAMREEKCNTQFLPDNPFPDNISVIDDFVTAIDQHDMILVAVPSNGFRHVLEQLQTHDASTLAALQAKGIIWATKGFDHQTGQLFSQVVDEILGADTPQALLTGPSFATEVASEHPTAVILATNNTDYGNKLQTCIHSDYFRTYLSQDMIGAQLGGTVKNIIAIAVGIADGLAFGRNTQSLLITRGLTEMIRLGDKMGAQQQTLIGLSGLGDLILTCSDNQSRNRRFGYLIGQGMSQQQACSTVKQVVEGIGAAKLVHQMAKQYRIELPIIEQVYALLYKNKPIKMAVQELLTRKVGKEFK